MASSNSNSNSNSPDSNSNSNSYFAIRLHKIGSNFSEGISGLTLDRLPRHNVCEALLPNSVKVEVQASAVNFFDLLITVGRYQHKPTLPHIMGSEASGRVTQIGSQVTRFRVGQDVIIPMGRNGGGMGQEMIVDEDLLIEKPKTLSYVQAAAIGVGFMTGYHGLVHRGKLKKGQWLLVTGAGGGMGLSACQIGRAVGAKVIAAAGSNEKLDMARKAGANYTVNYKEQNMKKEIEKITGGKWVDVCYDVVGGKVFDECVRVMAPEGRLLVVGFASGSIPKLSVNLALVKGFDVVGVRSGAEMTRRPELTAEMAQKLQEWTSPDYLAKGGWPIAPVIDRIFTLNDFKDAFRTLANREVIGKAVIMLQPDADKVPNFQNQSKL